MATPLTDAINALTTYANSVTGASDTILSDAVDTLAAGYGGGGGSGMPLLKSETVAANTRYVNVDLTPYLDKQYIVIAINFELTGYDWLYYAVNASAPQTSSSNYGKAKTVVHNTIPFLYGDIGDSGQVACVLPSSGSVFTKYTGSEAVSSLFINTYNASISIKAGSTYSIYGM